MSAKGDHLKKFIADVPNFPKAGIMFRDITPLLTQHFHETIVALAETHTPQEWENIDCLVGVEARGFIFASALASYLNKGLVLIRKAGKLPPPVVSTSYDLEYGSDNLEVKKGTGRALIVDDVLATGGTLKAAASLCEDAGYKVKGFITLIDIRFLNQFDWNGLKVKSVIHYD